MNYDNRIIITLFFFKQVKAPFLMNTYVLLLFNDTSIIGAYDLFLSHKMYFKTCV